MNVELNYICWTNLDSRFGRGMTAGDRLVRGYAGSVEAPDQLEADALGFINQIANLVFRIHNRDDRPDGQIAPSLSIGDVVQIGELAVTCTRDGWAIRDLADAKLITDRAWVDILA